MCAAPVLEGKTDQEKLASLIKKTHKEQAIWFLNAFWNDFASKEADNVWKYKAVFDKLDVAKKDQGNELDELNFHRFLEQIHETMTVKTCRDFLRDGGVEMTRVAKYISIAHYLVAKYKVSWKKLVNAAQGDNQEEIAKAQRLLDAVKAAFQEAEARENELRQALAELQKQEDEFNRKTEELKRKSQDPGSSTVQKSKASNELAQHLASDPLPLRRAKINTEAAKRKADAALEEARKRVEEAENFLAEVMARGGGSAKGTLWWMSTELQEAKKYMPQRKGGTAK